MAQGARRKAHGDEFFHSLCFPDNRKSCFACCPPIRPSGYEHIQYRKSVQRFLRENTRQFDPQEKTVKPIIGFSCWALGYLDDRFRLIGCLLHPAVNGGEDLRYRIEYGEKCSREACQESRIFRELDNTEQGFWLNLSQGLDSFAYSSRIENPLFNLLNWGSPILKYIAAEESKEKFDRLSFFRAYPFFTSQVNPKACAYLLNRIIARENIQVAKKKGFKECFHTFLTDLGKALNRELPDEEKGEYIHRLELDNLFLDFLRLSLKRSKMEPDQAEKLKEMIDEGLVRFKKTLQEKWL